MMIEMSPMLLETLRRANGLYMHAMVTDDSLKAERLKDDWRKDMIMLMIGFNDAVEAHRAGRFPGLPSLFTP